MNKYLLLLSSILILISCEQSREKEIAKIMQEWVGREIIFPTDLVFTVEGVDTIIDEKEKHYEYTVVYYVDSVGCTSCKLQLPLWKAFIRDVEKFTPSTVGIRLILCPKDLNDLLYTLKYHNFKYPVCIDLDDSFNKVNHLSSIPDFQTFLLDKDNRIVAIGNPIHNAKIKELFLKIIGGETSAFIGNMSKVLTTVRINDKSADMGTFDWKQKQVIAFTLTNTGDNPLVIESIDTSCGCTSVEYEEEPGRPGENITLQVTYNAEKPGRFYKTITVFCNAEKSPIKLTVSGNAI